MLNISVPLQQKYERNVDLQGRVSVLAEWNYNRFATVQSVTNGTNPVENEFDNDIFPLQSIVEPERPTRGIVKALVGTNTNADGFVTGGYRDLPGGTRYVVSSVEDPYKYWTSPNESGVSSPYAISTVTPTVVYAASVKTNKIRIALENSYASPSVFTVQVTTDGTNWTTVSTSPTIGSDGVIELYYQDAGTWSTTVNRSNSVLLRGVRLNVTNMDRAGVRFNLIEMGLRLNKDLSSDVISYTAESNMSDISFLSPIGRASSNEASVFLANETSVYTNDNPSSPYYKLLEKNVRIVISLEMNVGTVSVPSWETVRQFTGRSMQWTGQDRDGTTISITDDSEYLQSVNPPPLMFTEVSAAEVIWRVLDSVGFSNWNYVPSDIDATALVPVFWCDSTQTVWEVIAEIAEVTQTAVFFDEYGVLQVIPRAEAYNLAKTPVWQFDENTNGQKLSDVISINKEYDFEANTVDIEYTPTQQSEEVISGIRPMEVVWQPEDTAVLRSTQIVKTMFSTDQVLCITPSEAKVWPYTSVVQIEGEFMRYDAKEYAYRDASGVVQKAYVSTEDEKVAFDKLNPALAYLNDFTGRFRVPTANRGLWSTTPLKHDLTYSAWNSKKYNRTAGGIASWSGGFLPNPNSSTVRLKTNATFKGTNWYTCTTGTGISPTQPYYYGTRLRFDKSGYTWGAAGIAIGTGTNESGYFVEVLKSSNLTTAYRSKYNNEIWICYKDASGAILRLSKGLAINIVPGVWYDLDVKYTPGTNSRSFSVLVNGVLMGTVVHNATVPSYNKTDRCGIFVRGDTSAEFEYFYASNLQDNATFDDSTWWNRIKGGYQSKQFDSQYSMGNASTGSLTKKSSQKSPVKSLSNYLDDFGPIVHEVREYNVKFDPAPVTYSMVYFSNEAQIMCPEYNADAFGAKFIMTNISRENAVLSGEDTLTFGSENPVDQKFVVYGRNFISKDSRTYTVKDDDAIKRRGQVVTTITSKWIQSEEAAKKLGDWILLHWSGGADQISVEAFGNPFLQIGDVVTINSPTHSMTPSTSQFFVVGKSTGWDNGFTSTFTLRRRKI